MRIKTFSEWEYADMFQDKVNRWLKDKEDLLKIIDIKYSTTTLNGKILFSAIVIFSEN
ncbi:hypothetical protein [Clostridium sp.]